MNAKRHLTWEALEGMISGGRPFRLGIDGEPQLQLMVEDRGSRIGLLIPFPHSATLPNSGFEYVEVSTKIIDGTSWLYVSTSHTRLYQEFHAFLTGVADSIQIDHQEPIEAIGERLKSWKGLFARLKRLSSEEELGLIGELWMLLQLVRSYGIQALDSWTGPAHEPHDFRVGTFDFELKTTLNARRLHTIHGVMQLTPSPNMSLAIISLQLQPAAAAPGFSLPSLVEQIDGELRSDPLRATRFKSVLSTSFDFSQRDVELYPNNYVFRSLPRLIPVDGSCPRLDRTALENAVGPNLVGRILCVNYEIDLEGLGHELGSAEFTRAVPLRKE